MEHKTNTPLSYRVFTMVGLIVVWGLVSCENPSTVSQTDYSVVKGRIADEAAQESLSKTSGDMKDIAVTLARVRADGSLETVSQETVHTDVSGRFTLRTEVENENNLVVVATKGSAQWRAIISGKLENGQTTYCAPLSQETTVETEVFLRIRLYDKKGDITYADVQHQINTSVAAEVYGNGVAISQLASAIEAGFNAQNAVFMNGSGDVSEAEMRAIADAKTKLQSQFDTQLYHSSGNSPDKQMIKMFINGYLDAYGSAGIDVEKYAKSQTVANAAVMNTTGSMNDSLRFVFIQQIALFRAEVIDLIIQSRFETLGASDSVITAAANAGTELQASIEAATTLNELRTAFTTYHSTVIELLHITLDVNAELISQLDSSIWSNSGLYGSLEQSLSVSLTTEAIIDAYAEFYTAAESEAFAVLNTVASDAEITATVTILVMANFMA